MSIDRWIRTMKSSMLATVYMIASPSMNATLSLTPYLRLMRFTMMMSKQEATTLRTAVNQKAVRNLPRDRYAWNSETPRIPAMLPATLVYVR